MNLNDFVKWRYTFSRYDSPAFTLNGRWENRGDHAIGWDEGSELHWRGKGSTVLLLCGHHPWSGVVEFSARGRETRTVDLYSSYTYTCPVQVLSPADRLRPVVAPPPEPQPVDLGTLLSAVRSPTQLRSTLGKAALHWLAEGRNGAPPPEPVPEVAGEHWITARPVGKRNVAKAAQLVIYGALVAE
ncbi:MAG TPA: hypothetical protein VE153_34680 [Myxococcus sp.]|nr:hypothetical protein [Myxococcus sp.]